MFIKILYLIAIHTYYVGFISICNGIIGVQGPSSITAHNLVEVLFFVLFLSALNFWGMFVRVYPKIVQGLTFLNSVKHITIILARCTS